MSGRVLPEIRSGWRRGTEPKDEEDCVKKEKPVKSHVSKAELAKIGALNQRVSTAELAKIRKLGDFDLLMLISEIHDHGWETARQTLALMPPTDFVLERLGRWSAS